MNRSWLRLLGGLLLLQCVLIALYFGFANPEEPEPKELSYVTTQWIESVEAPLEPFEVERPDGTRQRVEPTRDVMIHFWATWCPSCVDELPQFLREARDRNLKVVAISLDEDWKTLDGFFDGEIPDDVFRARDGLAKKLGVTDLPQTIVVGDEGKARRYVGPRDWSVAFDQMGFTKTR